MPTTDDSRTDESPTAGGARARKAAILNAVVSEYIGSAQPVGSQHVVDAAGVSVSSATVRSDMAALERDGYLAQPHTSAGRIPTDKGYRFFVDHLARPGSLDPGGRHQVRQFFDHAHGEIELMLERTSGLLADLTDCAAMVVGPSHESAGIRSVQLVGLGPAWPCWWWSWPTVPSRSSRSSSPKTSTMPGCPTPRPAGRPLARGAADPGRAPAARTGDAVTDAVVKAGVIGAALPRAPPTAPINSSSAALPHGRGLRCGRDGAFRTDDPRAAVGGGHVLRTSSTPG